jgi:pyruvate,water dikinase
MAGMGATWWLNDHLDEWLGERNAADTLTLSAPDNITSEMGLALLDVADAVGPHPEVLAFLERVESEGFDDAGFLDALAALTGGDAVRDALAAFLERYGMRCVGEIDVTRPRWAERPTALVPAILTNVRTFGPGEAKRRFEHGRDEALAKRDSVLARLRELPDGEGRAQEAARMIDRVRTFAGYREHPKYAMVCRYFVYKQAIMAQADRLVEAGVLADRDDVLFLRLEELAEALREGRVDAALLRSRKAAFREHETLTPPRVLTSEGEMVVGAYRRDGLPDGALPGLGVSAGTVEGRARVAFDIGSAELEPGDILVTPFTDPSWTPVFVAAGGLVTEVGGLMTHGAVIAREYGLPAVVGVQQATRLIADGQRIRVHGTDGYVELLA